MATVRKKVTAGYHSCTGSEQCLSCGLVGLRCALGEIQAKRKHQRRTMVLTLFTKDAFPSAAGRMHTESPSAARPAIIPHVLSALLAAPHPIPPHYTGGRLGFWPSMSNPLSSSFPKAFVRYIISSDSCHVIREGNIMPFFLCQYCWGEKNYFGRFVSAFKCFGHICWLLRYQALVF